MNDLIKYYIKSLQSSTLSLKKKGLLVDKPWAMIDEDGVIQKLIFKQDKGLILSKNGKVTLGSWDYFPASKSLYIDRSVDKLLLNEQFIDENVLILKKDGTDNQFYALANENTIPDYNVAGYLETLRFEKLKIREVVLYTGEIIQIHNANVKQLHSLSSNAIEAFDATKNLIPISDGIYISECKGFSIEIKEGKVKSVMRNQSFKSSEDVMFEITDGSQYEGDNIGKYVTINGRPVEINEIRLNRSYDPTFSFALKIENSRIQRITFIDRYQLKGGYTIQVEQKSANQISEGDIIIDSIPEDPLPNGKYKIKGVWKSLVVEDSIIKKIVFSPM